MADKRGILRNLEEALSNQQADNLLLLLCDPALAEIKADPEVQAFLENLFCRLLTCDHAMVRTMEITLLYEAHDELIVAEAKEHLAKNVILYWEKIRGELLADVEHPQNLRETLDFVEDDIYFMLGKISRENTMLIYEGLLRDIQSGALLYHEEATCVTQFLFNISSQLCFSDALAALYNRIFDEICPHAEAMHMVFDGVCELALFFRDYPAVKNHLDAARNYFPPESGESECFQQLLDDMASGEYWYLD